MDKLNENEDVTRNKERLVCKGYAQEEDIDYGDTFVLVSRLKCVRILLAYVAHKVFKVDQMDVNFFLLIEYSKMRYTFNKQKVLFTKARRT